jgi:hypothetical protein
LLSLQVTTDSSDDPPRYRSISWQRLFELADLPWTEFRETSTTDPPLFADAVHRWEGPLSPDSAHRVAVAAASLRGRVVYFEVEHTWATQRSSPSALETGKQSSRYRAVRTSLWLVVIGVAAVLAWRHVQQGHVDWRGAWRVTAAVLILGTLDWVCGSRHTLVVTEEIAAALDWLNLIVVAGVMAGMAYLAVEPSARRWWPWSLITIRRLLDGRLNDRAIWADALLGVVMGLLCVSLRQLCTLINQLYNVPVSGLNDFDPSQNLLDHFGLRYKVAVIISALLLAVIDSLLMLTLVVALKRATKSTPIAALLVVLLLTALAIVGRGIISPIDWLARGLLLSIAAWLVLRHGLLATVAALATFYAVNNAPLTLDWSRWYAATGFVVVVTVAAVLFALWRFAWPRHNRTIETALTG